MIEIDPEPHVTTVDGTPLMYFKFDPYSIHTLVQMLSAWLTSREFKNWQIHSLEYVAFTDADEAKRFLSIYPNFKQGTPT